MNGTNPYEAPRAPLMTEAPLEGLAEALRGFVVTKNMVRSLAVLAILCGIGGLLLAVAVASTNSPYVRAFATPIVPTAIAYVIHGTFHWRLALRIRDSERKPELGSVVALLAALRHSWLASVALYVVSFGTAVMSGAGLFTAMGTLVFADAVADGAKSEGRRLFNVLRLAIAGSIAVTMLLVFEQARRGAAYGLGAAAVLAPLGGAYTWLLWKQAGPLAAFIASPSPDTLRPLARAHRLLWLVLTVATTLLVAFVLLALFLMVAFAPSLPDQQ